ncbi:replication-associated protein [army ant associated cyclovirus 8 P1A-reste_2]|uniref:Replication-associated protein n=1 Tax=army ant associated cyclovirus 8 P1A-reste_2 TaxID=3070167 RepID=A0AA47KVJ5_9CIRC|nr:replication-associated protein [Army ant associated cyclovirus 8]WBG01486.1 replication-associated protein [Army ant associated cyclovirus 8]
MSNSTVNKFCFTWNNYSEEEYERAKDFLDKFCKYGIIGKETAPGTGTKHLQGYCSLVKTMRFNAIKKHLDSKCHIEKANGTDEQNQTYCRKGGDWFEKGSPIKKGQRSDLQSVLETVAGGTTSVREIAEKHPAAYIRYHRGIREWLRITHPIKARDFATTVNYYWGPTGSGKSRRALKEAKELCGESIYYKPRGLWWDSYHQQEGVIIDDFYGWIKYDELLKICDRYPYQVQIKGGFEEFTTKYIWITSNVDTCDLYKFINYNDSAIVRRITNKIYID